VRDGIMVAAEELPNKRREGGREGGREGRREGHVPMVPTPGPPPPWGMQNVLCRFKWQTSAPMRAGEVRATWAFMFAPSM